MATTGYALPFGEQVRLVRQHPGKAGHEAFVLGVHASAVRAEWRDPDGKLRCQALAVASEPEIFWRGDRASEIPARIDAAGHGSRPAGNGRNGPSGRHPNERYLKPPALARWDVRLCDLVPQPMAKDGQIGAVERCSSLAPRFGLSPRRSGADPATTPSSAWRMTSTSSAGSRHPARIASSRLAACPRIG